MLQPLSLDELHKHYQEGKCLVVEGQEDKFSGLVSLDDIERRLNDGCNAHVFAQTIKNGTRQSNLNSDTPWSPATLNKVEFRQEIESGLSFMMANSSQISSGIAQLSTEIEDYFSKDNVHADVHLYISTNSDGNSYRTHRDIPQHKILLQAHGDANWQLFNPIKDIPDNLRAISEQEQDDYLEMASEFTLSQGDMLYMPPGVFHRVISVGGPRISISIPFFSMPEASRMDRSAIPFKTIFQSNLLKNTAR